MKRPVKNIGPGMAIITPKQLQPEVSSLAHPLPNIRCNNSNDDSPTDQNRKFISIVESSSSTMKCVEFVAEDELSASVSSSDYDLLFEELQRVGCDNPKKKRSRTRRKSCGSGSTKNSAEKRGKNVRRRRQVGNCAASFAGDCAAVCCCPCAILHLVILVFVVIPSVLATNVFRYVKRKARNRRKLQNYKMNDEDEVRKPRYNTPPGSYTQSPRTSGLLDRSLVPMFDPHKVWWDLYAAGHMGFGGLPFERD